MVKKIQIQINDSSISLSLSEFWYFHYYLKNISSFYNKVENSSKKVMITFPGTSLHLIADKDRFKNISSQVKSYVKNYSKDLDIYDD